EAPAGVDDVSRPASVVAAPNTAVPLTRVLNRHPCAVFTSVSVYMLARVTVGGFCPPSMKRVRTLPLAPVDVAQIAGVSGACRVVDDGRFLMNATRASCPTLLLNDPSGVNNAAYPSASPLSIASGYLKYSCRISTKSSADSFAAPRCAMAGR